MNEDFSTENLKVGDKVIVTVFGNLVEGKFRCIGDIVKKTPTGLVDVIYGKVKERFKQNGTEYARGDKWSRRSVNLEYATEERIKEVQEENKCKFLTKFCKEFDYSKLGIEDLQAVYQIIKDKV